MKFRKLSPEVLRRHNGVSIIGVSTIAFLHDGNGKMFLVKRGKNSRDEHGVWAPIAGRLEHGETAEAGMRRELKEECGIESLKIDFIGYFDAFRVTQDGLPAHSIVMCFVAKIKPGEVKVVEPDKVDDWGWFESNALPYPLHSQFDAFLDKLGDELQKIVKG